MAFVSTLVGCSSERRFEGTFGVLESRQHGPELCTSMLTSDPPQCGGVPVVGWDWNAVEGEDSANGTTWGAWHLVGTFDGKRFTLTEIPGRAQPPRRDRDPDFSAACADPDVVDPSQGMSAWEEASPYVTAQDLPGFVTAWMTTTAESIPPPIVGNVVVLPGGREEAITAIRRHYGGPLCVVERNGPTAAELEAVQAELGDAASRPVLGVVQRARADFERGAVLATVWLADERAVDYAHDRWGDLVELEGLLKPVG